MRQQIDIKLVKKLQFRIYWLILRSEISLSGKTMVVAMVTDMVAMVTIIVAMEMEPVAVEFMAGT